LAPQGCLILLWPQKAHQEQPIARLQGEYGRLQARLDAKSETGEST
jgi:hypothetical protein